MKDYLFVLLGAVIISGIVGMIAPEGDLKKYVSLLLCFCVLTAVVKPISEIMGGVMESKLEFSEQSSEQDYKSVYEEYLLSANEGEFAERLRQKMSSELKIPSGQIGIYADMTASGGEYKLQGITVELYGMGVAQNPEKIKEYIYGHFGVECVIVYG